ncbi:MAG: hypothetical protein QW587_05050 [Candidatus Bathyarchaeia archaeon]
MFQARGIPELRRPGRRGSRRGEGDGWLWSPTGPVGWVKLMESLSARLSHNEAYRVRVEEGLARRRPRGGRGSVDEMGEVRSDAAG